MAKDTFNLPSEKRAFLLRRVLETFGRDSFRPKMAVAQWPDLSPTGIFSGLQSLCTRGYLVRNGGGHNSRYTASAQAVDSRPALEVMVAQNLSTSTAMVLWALESMGQSFLNQQGTRGLSVTTHLTRGSVTLALRKLETLGIVSRPGPNSMWENATILQSPVLECRQKLKMASSSKPEAPQAPPAIDEEAPKAARTPCTEGELRVLTNSLKESEECRETWKTRCKNLESDMDLLRGTLATVETLVGKLHLRLDRLEGREGPSEVVKPDEAGGARELFQILMQEDPALREKVKDALLKKTFG